MIKKIVILIGVLVFSYYTALAQKTAVFTSEEVEYQKALDLYNSKQYLSAQNLFDAAKNKASDEGLKSNCSYYVANCAARLNQQNTEDLITYFIENYPTSSKRNLAFIDMAHYHFGNSDYEKANEWYKKVDEIALPFSEKEKFNFNYGYCNYITKNYRIAEKHLTRVENSNEYGVQAKYYIGFIAYQADDYSKASGYFENVSENQKYKENLTYYQADLNFKSGNFQNAISLAEEQLENSNPNEISELSKIIGESYFNLQKYAEAIPFLKAYKGKNGKWNNTDYYQLGYAYYKQNEFDSAISEFNKIIDGKNSVTQNAYYHLGESYVKLDKKQEALNAFRNASQMEFDKRIQEDAWLNYAKLSYDIGNPYQSVSEVLIGYLERYPNTLFKNDIEQLLIDSYITSKNYKLALVLLDGKTNYDSKVAFQKVAFYRAIELFNENKYNEAKLLFQKSLNQPLDEYFTTRATFWKAETDYTLNDFKSALIGFKQFKSSTNSSNTPENDHIDYNIAYTYFKQKIYDQAISFFKLYLKSNLKDKLRENDTYLRLADGYFVTSNYDDAIKAYTKALKINVLESDYAAFQKALSYGYLDNSDAKINALETFIKNYPKSAFLDDALYDLANSYVKKNQTDIAMKKYNILLSDFEESPFVSKALLRQGLVYYNSGSTSEALEKFKIVAKVYPGTQEALQAVSSARLVYIDLGQVNSYAKWVKTLGYINVTNTDLDNTTYEAAEKQYLANNFNKAIKQYNYYLSGFPEGLHAVKAHFYLAQLYDKDDLGENALPHYQYVINKPSNEFTETALVKTSRLFLDQKKWREALPVLERLEKESGNPQNIIFAQSNLMKALYQLESYNQAVEWAEKVILNSKIDSNIESDAYLIIARSAFSTGDESKAKEAYAQVEAKASGIRVAEALYYNAYFKNKAGDFEESNTVIQALVKNYASYKYYSAKALIVMAKNYNALDDAFQAIYILESVTENFKEFDDVLVEAKATLETFKKEQAKTNTSVETESKN